MVSSEVVMQTVKRMISSGVDDETIKMTLRGINMPDSEIDSIIAQAKQITPGQARAAEDAVSGAEEGLGENGQDSDEGDDGQEAAEGDESDAENAGEEEESSSEESDEDLGEALRDASQEQQAHHTTTHTMLEEHSNKMDDLHRNVSAIHEKIDSAPRLSAETVSKLGALDSRLSGLERQVAETKANTLALQELLQKILDTNRKILIELQKK